MATRKTKRTTRVLPAIPSEVVKHVSASPCSVEVSRDAKGQARWVIKLYGEAEHMDSVVDEGLRLDDRLRRETRGGQES